MTSHHNRMQWKTPALHLPLPPLLALGTQATAAALRIGLSPTGSGFSARLSPLVLASGPPHTGRGSGLLDTMVKLTMIARVTDGLPLAEGLDDGRDLKDSDFYKQQAKLLFKNLSKGHHEASRMSIETGPYYFQYPCAVYVPYVCVCIYSSIYWVHVSYSCL
ncbi:25.3 kDa vesicle transport protein [Zea mays]|uniref:25.3 kDa vesicle transport protein n=2 Tax=Zea mays TaxID=4577 RepID=A0A1D6L7D9_MAIZE|nr:25.3 kDa vesicle transport protein [Zea mays]